MSLSILEEYIETGNAAAIDDLLHGNPSLAQERTSHDISPLLLACYYNKPQIVKVLLKHLERATIHEAAAAGLEEEVIQALANDGSIIDQISDHGFTPIGIASHFNREDIVRYLLYKGADPNLQSQNGYNVYPIHTAAGNSYLGIAKLLVEGGADVNVFQASRHSPLHLAAQNGNIDMIILLLENGAAVEVKDDSGKTAADLAAEKGHGDIARILAV